MRNIRVDADGKLHCAQCGATEFFEKRTFAAKATGVASAPVTMGLGLFAPLLTRKKLRCKACGTYNRTGGALKYEPSAERPWYQKTVGQNLAEKFGPKN